MPFQQINLDQSIYNKKKQQQSPYSQALTPQRQSQGQGQSGVGHLTAAGATDSYVEQQKARWAAEDKEKKAERERKIQEAQEMGMRIRAGLEKETQTTLRMNQQRQQQQVAQQQQQVAQQQKIESNPEPAAKEMYELLKTLPDEAKAQLLNQIFTPTSTGGSISSDGKEVKMGAKYNPIANVFIEKGWAMFDQKGNVSFNEAEDVYEKGTFEIVEKGGVIYKINTATGEEIVLGKTGKPEDVVNKINKEANEKGLALSKEGEVSFEDAKYDALIDNGVDPEVAADLAKVKGIPDDPNDKNWFKDTYKKAVDWVKSRGAKEPTKKDWEKAASATAKPTFNEANVTSLANVISDDVTPAERAHLISQGATDADIDEAIKRKAK